MGSESQATSVLYGPMEWMFVLLVFSHFVRGPRRNHTRVVHLSMTIAVNIRTQCHQFINNTTSSAHSAACSSASSFGGTMSESNLQHSIKESQLPRSVTMAVAPSNQQTSNHTNLSAMPMSNIYCNVSPNPHVTIPVHIDKSILESATHPAIRKTKSFKFMNFALEIQREVYRHLLTNPILAEPSSCSIENNNGILVKYGLSPYILRVSKKVYKEAA